ncbi:MAG: anti-CBASS Acb1 family protein, partial [Prevotella sp.]|nr:anti-CBASS Acb1 family protein [Prevotella sp.]
MTENTEKSRLYISPSTAEDIASNLMMPQRTFRAFDSIDKVRRAFALPVSMGAPKDEREALDMAFDSAGGYSTIYESLQQHAGDMGQYPITSFIGYGALQQIAQNGMIRACIQTVADDITREWIEVKGGDDTEPEDVRHLEDLLDQKYHLKDLFHSAAATMGYMGGAFIFIDTGAEGEDLALPLRISSLSAEMSEGMALRFTLVDPVNVSPGDYNATNPLQPDYMRPKCWWVLGQKVHASRMISVFDNPPPLLL